MRTAAIRFGVALAVAVAGITSTHAVAGAQPETHQIQYTVTTDVEANFTLYYLYNEPADQAAVDADPAAYLHNDRVKIVPGTPWVFQTTLADTQWAFINAGSAHRVAPNPHCEITIDGEVVVQQDGLSGAQCALRAW